MAIYLGNLMREWAMYKYNRNSMFVKFKWVETRSLCVCRARNFWWKCCGKLLLVPPHSFDKKHIKERTLISIYISTIVYVYLHINKALTWLLELYKPVNVSNTLTLYVYNKAFLRVCFYLLICSSNCWTFYIVFVYAARLHKHTKQCHTHNLSSQSLL